MSEENPLRPPATEEDCHQRYAQQGEKECPSAWDSLFCWPPTAAGSNVSYPCSSIFPFLLSTDATAAVAFRRCEENGSWSWGGWTNYSECELLDIQLQEGVAAPISPLTISVVVFVVSFVSLLSLCAALFIFSAFESLQCSRIRVHRNLVLSLILHALLMISVSSAGFSEDMGTLFRNTEWLCKGVLVLKTYSAMASVHWMFVEGLLLHSSITVSVFERQPPFKLYYAIGWGIPSLCVSTWIILMGFYWKKSCWEGYGQCHFIWVVTGPMMAALLVNAVFLVNIVRILVTKMRTNVAIETKQVKKAMRATALLFPLLGITHLLFCINPGGEWEPLYMLVNAVLQSSQGLFVAVLYCFLNSEVQSVLTMAYTRRSSVWTGSRRQRSSRMFGTSISTALQPPDNPSPIRPPTSKEEEDEETAFTLHPDRPAGI